MANLWIILLWRNAMADEGTYIASSLLSVNVNLPALYRPREKR